MTTVKITELTNIGANLATSTVVPVVNMAGTPTTQKTTVGNIANLILEGAGTDYPEASVALLAQTVSNAAQPNITSTGTLTGLTVSGNTNLGSVANVRITGGTAGQILSTDGAGNLSWASDSGGSYGNSNVAAYLPTYTGNVGANWVIASYFMGNAHNLTYLPGANVNGAVAYATTANSVAGANVSGAVTYATTANSVAAANVSGLGNVALSNYDGNASNVLHGDGSWSADTTTYSNSNVASFLAAFGSNTITTTGNISVGNITATNLGNVALVNFDGNSSNVLYGNGVFDGVGSPFNQDLNTTDSVTFANITSTEAIRFSNSGNIVGALGYAPNYVSIEGYQSNSVVVTANDVYSWTFGSDGLTTLPDGAIIDTTGNNFEVRAVENVNLEANAVVNIYTDGSGNAYQWQFGDDGNLTLPTNGSIIVDGGDGVVGPVSDDLVISWDNEEIRLVSVQGSIEMQADAAFRVQTNYDGANVLYASRWEFTNNEIVNISNNFGIVSEAGNLNLSGGRDGVNSGNTTISAVATGVAVNTWTFDNTGNLTLAGGNSVIFSTANSSLDPTLPNVSTMTLTPDANYNSQVLVLDPTAPGHIHLRAHAFSNIDDPAANIFLGGEDTAFEITSGSNNEARIHSNNYTWTFDNTGNLNTGNIIFDTAGRHYIYYGANNYINLYNDGGMDLSCNTEIKITTNYGDSPNRAYSYFYANGTFSAGGNITTSANVSGNVGLFNDVNLNNAGTNAFLYTDSNRNIYDTQFGYDSANDTMSGGNVSLTGTISATNIGNISSINIDGNASNVLYGNGVFAAAPGGSSYGDSNVVTLLSAFGSNTITTTGNVSVGNISGNTNGYTLGYLNIPQVAASNTTLALGDAGKHYYSTTAGNLTLTIPNNATTSFATGTAISIVVQAAGNVLVNAAAGVTLYMAGNSTAANRVVGTYGMATLMKVASDTWFINGTGVS